MSTLTVEIERTMKRPGIKWSNESIPRSGQRTAIDIKEKMHIRLALPIDRVLIPRNQMNLWVIALSGIVIQCSLIHDDSAISCMPVAAKKAEERLFRIKQGSRHEKIILRHF